MWHHHGWELWRRQEWWHCGRSWRWTPRRGEGDGGGKANKGGGKRGRAKRGKKQKVKEEDVEGGVKEEEEKVDEEG